MKVLNISLIVFNLLMLVWSIVNIYNEYSSVWMFNIIQSTVFSIFWIFIYVKYLKSMK